MSATHISRGFAGRREAADAARIPPGQYVTRDFPVPLDQWTFTIDGAVDAARTWLWEEVLAVPQETPTADIHCVTKWSKLDTSWRGVPVDTLLEEVDTAAEYVTAWCDGGYATNLVLTLGDEPGLWETYGYHDHGDPWLQQRYQSD